MIRCRHGINRFALVAVLREDRGFSASVPGPQRCLA